MAIALTGAIELARQLVLSAAFSSSWRHASWSCAFINVIRRVQRRIKTTITTLKKFGHKKLMILTRMKSFFMTTEFVTLSEPNRIESNLLHSKESRNQDLVSIAPCRHMLCELIMFHISPIILSEDAFHRAKGARAGQRKRQASHGIFPSI
mmetsp:Transcript_9430/g.26471  ORF Transcript_9430/g.26471 Transcript_9430/m.26471 type:complete len:151 (+) Transcript_9430:478-930(+)